MTMSEMKVDEVISLLKYYVDELMTGGLMLVSDSIETEDGIEVFTLRVTDGV